MYTCIIVEDEDLARERLTHYVDSRPGWEVVAAVSSYQDAWQSILVHKPSLCLLDINIIGGSGVELAFRVKNHVDTKWVFTTAIGVHAIDAFELSAVDYILKPFTSERLDHAFIQVEELLAKNVVNIANVANVAKGNNFISVKLANKLRFINIEEIIYIKGAANYVQIVCKDGSFLHRSKISSMEASLPDTDFIRIHRSTIVNLKFLESMNSDLGRYSFLQMSNGGELKIGEQFKGPLLQRLGVKI